MSSGLSISENISITESNIKKLQEQIVAINTEIVRLEGGLRVFKNMQDLGIEQIPIPKDQVDNTEVIDTLDWPTSKSAHKSHSRSRSHSIQHSSWYCPLLLIHVKSCSPELYM